MAVFSLLYAAGIGHHPGVCLADTIKQKASYAQMSVQPFTIHVPQTVLDDLHNRLARTRWPREVAGAGWDYGTNVGYMKELADYWQHQYDWRKQEAALNRF